MPNSDDMILAKIGPQDDPVSRPKHYVYSDIEPIDVIESWGLGFHLGCVVKYLCRAGRKGDRLQDLKKAAWYLEREILREVEPEIDTRTFADFD